MFFKNGLAAKRFIVTSISAASVVYEKERKVTTKLSAVPTPIAHSIQYLMSQSQPIVEMKANWPKPVEW